MQAPDVMGPTGAFGFYAGLNLVAWGMIFCFVRETKQLTLEEIDRKFFLDRNAVSEPHCRKHYANMFSTEVFSVPTAQFLRHEASVRTPWFFKRYFLFQKHLPEPPATVAKDDHYERKSAIKA